MNLFGRIAVVLFAALAKYGVDRYTSPNKTL